MTEYEQAQAVAVSPEAAFTWLSDVGNLPDYLPPVTNASIQGSSEGDNPGQKVLTTLEYPGGDGSFDAEGYLAVDEGARRMEWGAEAGRDYSGWLEVAPDGDGSLVTVHLSFGERSVEPEAEEQSPEGEHPMAEGIAATLESIRRQLEEGSGKVEPPAPPDDPPTDENPAVVRDDPPDDR